MKLMVIDGVTYSAYGPDEIAGTISAPTSSRNSTALEQVIRLLGSSESIGPLAHACRRAAESGHRGGHSPASRRADRLAMGL